MNDSMKNMIIATIRECNRRNFRFLGYLEKL